MELSPCWTEIVDVELIAETERFKKERLVLTKLHDEAQFAETLKNFLASSALFLSFARNKKPKILSNIYSLRPDNSRHYNFESVLFGLYRNGIALPSGPVPGE